MGATLGCRVKGRLVLGSACAVEAFSVRPFKGAVLVRASVGAGCHAAAVWGAAWGAAWQAVWGLWGLRGGLQGGCVAVRRCWEGAVRRSHAGRVWGQAECAGGTWGIAWGADGRDRFLEHKVLQDGGNGQGLAGAGSEVPLLRRMPWFVCGASGCSLQHTRGSQARPWSLG